MCYIPAFWHISGLFLYRGVFSFFQASKDQTSQRVPLHHTQPMLTTAIANRYRTTHTPLNRTKSTLPYHIQNTTNLIPKPFLLIFTHFRQPLTTEIISTNSTSNSTRITFISFTFDGDSFYFCLLFHRIQPYLYPFIQTK